MAKVSLFQIIKMVLAGFVGIRKAADSNAVQKQSLKIILITAVGCGLCLFGLLVLLVNMIMRYAY